MLIREWRGVRHRVTVLDDGVVYRDRHYKSLSEVARAITGSADFFDNWDDTATSPVSRTAYRWRGVG